MNTKFLWSVRRELWEHRSIYVAPLFVAGLVLIGFLFKVGALAAMMRTLSALDPAKQRVAAVLPFTMPAAAILFISFVVALFYCLDALYGERRDRSILFWKSMPVSDRTTVLSKAFVALAVIPFVSLLIAVTTQVLLLVLSSVVLLIGGVEISTLWSNIPFVQMTLAMIYGLVVHALWYAPVYGWLLLVSSWAKKAPFLWATAPVFAAFVFEKIALDSSYVFALVKYRAIGAMTEAFAPGAMRGPVTQLSQLDPVRFLSSSGLWLGLAVAVAFLFAAIHMRRSREPI
ncbi:hypothetical protein BWI17_06890 [Betaproteobacteria bacterium GR16-43]|nr:hypothetical protein BWI17_06890 [Betaproteobacteria bacterium GR16-43]